MKRDEVRIHRTIWTDLENSDRSYTLKVTWCDSVYNAVQTQQIHPDRKQMSGSQGLGTRRGGHGAPGVTAEWALSFLLG